MSVAQVARRYDLNANQIFNWLKDPRFAPDNDADEDAPFLPVEIVEPTQAADAPAPAPDGLIELDLAGGHRLRVIGRFDPDALALTFPPD